jgi:hypothetical protein
VSLLVILSQSLFGLKARSGRELRTLDQRLILFDGELGITYEEPVEILRARAKQFEPRRIINPHS